MCAGLYVWDWQFFVTTACLAWRMQVRDERRRPSTPNTRLAVLTAGVPPHASTPLFDVPTVAGMDTAVIEAGAPFDEVLAAVQTYAPTHLVGYASVIGRLARASLAGDLRIRPSRVSTNSEPLLPEDRDAIVNAWHAPLHNLWGSTELGVQAVGCGYGPGLHICEDEVILERVDDTGAPVAPDEPAARTLATGLSNRTFPFIRYDLGDEITMMSDPCACGSAFARVADISGRHDDDFVYGPHPVPASAFRHVLGTDPRIIEYQVHADRGRRGRAGGRKGRCAISGPGVGQRDATPRRRPPVDSHPLGRDPGPQSSQRQAQTLRTTALSLTRRPAHPARSTPVVRKRLRYVPGEMPRLRRKVRRMVSAPPKPARRAMASWLSSSAARSIFAASSRARSTNLAGVTPT